MADFSFKCVHFINFMYEVTRVATKTALFVFSIQVYSLKMCAF